MEIKRYIYQDLLTWKNEYQGKMALLIEGARRIGKSTLAMEFGQNEYKSFILIDFNKASKRVKDNFDNLNDLDIFFQNLSLEYNTHLYPRESLIIFDEIQRFPKAREAIKYLVADGRYDYIETGSLISIKETIKNITIPSEEQKLTMYPVTFPEFMEYMDANILKEYIENCYKKNIPLEEHAHRQAMRLFMEYILVGGMPQALVAYKHHNRDFYYADKEKRAILALYKEDINKASQRYQSKVAAIFDNIPGFLSNHEKRIILNNIDSNGRYSRYDEPLFWLGDSLICNLCYKCNDPNVGLALNKNNSFVKCYMGDTGLLISHTFNETELENQELYREILNNKLSINKGMFFENVIAQMIKASHRSLYFYTHYNDDTHHNDIEIDFILTNKSKTHYKIYPLEVKSTNDYDTTSLDSFNKKFKDRIDKSIIIHPKNLTIKDNIIKYPPYMFYLFLQ